jgi:protocatechuate 4,5-dioxygenase alpha chain
MPPSHDLPPPGLDLAWPATLLYDPALALRGHRLTQCALSLRQPEHRASFLADEAGYLRDWGLPSEQVDAVLRRDWTALLRAGGHLQAILKIAATVGQGLWHIGAHHVGTDVATLQAACPRCIGELPGEGA